MTPSELQQISNSGITTILLYFLYSLGAAIIALASAFTGIVWWILRREETEISRIIAHHESQVKEAKHDRLRYENTLQTLIKDNQLLNERLASERNAVLRENTLTLARSNEVTSDLNSKLGALAMITVENIRKSVLSEDTTFHQPK